jgi:hypothetical protein
VESLRSSVSEAVRAAGPIPIETDDGGDFAQRCDKVLRGSAVVLERLGVIQNWFTDRRIDRLWPPDEPVRREGREIVAEFARLLEPWVRGIASEASDIADIWLPELVALRTDRQTPLGRQLARVRAAYRDHPPIADTVEACGQVEFCQGSPASWWS